MVNRNKLVRIVASVALPTVVMVNGCGMAYPKPGTPEYETAQRQMKVIETVKQIGQGKQFSEAEKADPIYQEAERMVAKDKGFLDDLFWWGPGGTLIKSVIRSDKKAQTPYEQPTDPNNYSEDKPNYNQ